MGIAVLVNMATGQEHFLPASGRVVLGRSRECDIVLSDHGISRSHARITITKDAFLIEDMQSRNGTYVDADMITEPTPITHGSIITIGRARLEFVTDQRDLAESRETSALTLDDLMLHGIECVLPARAPSYNVLADATREQAATKAVDLPGKLANLLDMNAVLASIRSENALLTKLATQVSKTFPQSARCIVTLKKEGREGIDMRAVAYSGKREKDETMLPVSAAIVTRVMETGEAILTSKAPVDVAFATVKEDQPVRLGPVMCSPLWQGKGVVGTIYLDALPDGDGFTREELGLLVVISKQASLMLQSVHAYEEVCRQKNDLSVQNERLRDEASRRYDFGTIIGSSRRMGAVIDEIKKACQVETSVLILGQTGTGKELIARAIHYNGPRRAKEFVTVNCAAIAKDLQESELFGHEKGAFTGAGAGRKGLVEIADGGTLFLDEIGDMATDLQAKLLRVVENKEVRRVGSSRATTVNVRIVAATNRDLAEAVKQGSFRADLYHRLNVFTIRVPPLAERPEDTEELACHFLDLFSRSMGKHLRGFDPEAIDRLRKHPWPGNVRELKNVIERLVIEASEGASIGPEDLPWDIQSGALPPAAAAGRLDEVVSSVEKEMIESTLKRNHGNKSKTASELGLSRGGLDRKIRRYGIKSARD